MDSKGKEESLFSSLLREDVQSGVEWEQLLILPTLASYSRTNGGKSICSGGMAVNNCGRLSTWWILSFSPETVKVVKNHVETLQSKRREKCY